MRDSVLKRPAAVTVTISNERQEAVVSGDCWDPAYTAYICGNKIERLELNGGKGWRGRDLSFLSELPHLVSLTIIGTPITSGLAAIQNLQNLKWLSLQCGTEGKLDFEALPNLVSCALSWKTGLDSFTKQPRLEDVALLSYRKPNLRNFSRLHALRRLHVFGTSLTDCSGIEACSEVEMIAIANARKLSNISSLSELSKLQTLHFAMCKNLSSLEPLRKLKKLDDLVLEDCGTISSLKPLEGTANLKTLDFDGTTVLDGDIEPLRALHLDRITFLDEPHYTSTLASFSPLDKAWPRPVLRVASSS